MLDLPHHEVLVRSDGMTSAQDDLAELDDTVICPDGKAAGTDRSCIGQGGASSPGLEWPAAAEVAAKP